MSNTSGNYLWWALALLLIGGGGKVVWGKTRGLRNNNPGNIRRTSDAWLGLSASQTDEAFFQFDTAVYGIRAMAKLLRNYQSRHGLNTVQGIIGRWAPPSENDTGAYVRAVSAAVGVEPNEPINTVAGDQLRLLVGAIIKHENGINPYPADLIAEGIALA